MFIVRLCYKELTSKGLKLEIGKIKMNWLSDLTADLLENYIC